MDILHLHLALDGVAYRGVRLHLGGRVRLKPPHVQAISVYSSGPAGRFGTASLILRGCPEAALKGTGRVYEDWTAHSEEKPERSVELRPRGSGGQSSRSIRRQTWNRDDEISTIIQDLKRVERQLLVIDMMVDPDGTLDALSNLGITSPLADPKTSPGTQQGALHPDPHSQPPGRRTDL
ncbi:hypothetical protein INR49_023067 [Caranx melampygus]|nr:hypothetical protein INR49_023067 [Caranx melampygus]